MGIFIRRFEAAALLVGTIIGVGMFGIPFVFSAAGFWTGAVLLVFLTAATTLVHIAYFEIVSASASFHRLPGYARIYLGPFTGWLASASYFLGLSGALLAYLVLGGSFLNLLIGAFFAPAPLLLGPALFALIGAIVISRGLRFEAAANGILAVLLVGTVVLFSVMLFPSLEAGALAPFDLSKISIPYGAILFALSGAAVIPELARLIGREKRGDGRVVITIGTALPAVLYFLFALAVVGALGAAVSPDAVSAVADRFGVTFRLLGGLVGFLACVTSFIGLGVVLGGSLATDFGIPTRVATAATIALPIALYLAGFRDFISIISVIGALMIGFEGILTILIFPRAVPASRRPRYLSASVRWLLILVFSLGILAFLPIGR